MKKVLVLCTGNSCRSIMGEALINHLGAGKFEAVSAGSMPTGYVHPKALETLKRHDVPPPKSEMLKSQSWDDYENETFDYVISVCNQAAQEFCPVFLGAAEKIHWDIEDPAKVEGSEAQIDEAFDAAFLKLKTFILTKLL